MKYLTQICVSIVLMAILSGCSEQLSQPELSTEQKVDSVMTLFIENYNSEMVLKYQAQERKRRNQEIINAIEEPYRLERKWLNYSSPVQWVRDQMDVK